MITATKPENRHDSRNKMTFERLKYYRHLGGGGRLNALPVVFLKHQNPYVFLLWLPVNAIVIVIFVFGNLKKAMTICRQMKLSDC